MNVPSCFLSFQRHWCGGGSRLHISLKRRPKHQLSFCTRPHSSDREPSDQPSGSCSLEGLVPVPAQLWLTAKTGMPEAKCLSRCGRALRQPLKQTSLGTGPCNDSGG